MRTTQGEERVRATLTRQLDTTRIHWEKQLWHLGNQRFACEPDAQTALKRQVKRRPARLTVQAQLILHPKKNRPGRPRQGTAPDRILWQIQANVSVDADALTRAVQRKAAFLAATNMFDAAQLTDQEVIRTHQE